MMATAHISRPTALTLSLRSLMDDDEAYGREGGEAVFQRLAGQIEAHPSVSVFRISLSGVRRMDVSFAARSVTELAPYLLSRGNRSERQFACLTDMAECVGTSIAAAAAWRGLRIHAVVGGVPRLLGVPLTVVPGRIYDLIAGTDSLRAAEVAGCLGCSVQNASNQLRKLWRDGVLARSSRIAPTGGIEYHYYVPR